ncbi:MAG: ABC transporter ATP-binding protein [Thermoplasmata archaeon]|nr:ABC transporter ATP-binding protein [Thermoplasmata archaeon]
MGDVIVVRDLVKRFNDRVEVLNGLAFSIAAGDFVAVYGKSGCGKTSLLNILGGLDRPTSGHVSIEGEDIVDMSEDDLARLRLNKVGFVFQDYNLLNNLTVRENIEMPLKFSGKADGDRVDYLQEIFGIGHVSNDTANRISGGEAQRTAIARAMMNEPSIILADEPTGNLDDENAENVMEMFQLARREFGTTIVLATHDSQLAKHASRAMHLRDGKINDETQR